MSPERMAHHFPDRGLCPNRGYDPAKPGLNPGLAGRSLCGFGLLIFALVVLVGAYKNLREEEEKNPGDDRRES